MIQKAENKGKDKGKGKIYESSDHNPDSQISQNQTPCPHKKVLNETKKDCLMLRVHA